MIGQIIRDYMRRILQNYDRNAPYLSGWNVNREEEVHDCWRVELWLENGTRHSFQIMGSVIRQMVGLAHNNVDLAHLLPRQFAIAYEDHLMELDVRDAHNVFDDVRRNSNNPHEIAAAYQRYQETSRRIETHYHNRRGEVSALAQGIGRPIQIWRQPLNLRDTAADQPLPEIETLTPQQIARMPFAERERYLINRLQRRQRLDPLAYERLLAILQTDNVDHDAARKRGIELLKQHLSPEQLAQYESQLYFDVVGSMTGKKYRIHHGRASNVFRLSKTNIPECGYCFLTEGGLCEGDVMLAQKLALECNEPAALKVANQF